MKRRLTKLTAAGLVVLALTGCTGGVPEEVSEEPPVPKNVETTWILVVGQPEGSTCWDAAESFAEALSDATEGAVAVEVQPMPLDRVTSLEQAAAGIVDLYLDSSFVYGSYGDEEELGRPFFSVTMPFLFPDAETAAEVLDSTGGEALTVSWRSWGSGDWDTGSWASGIRPPTGRRLPRRTWKGCASARLGCWNCQSPTWTVGEQRITPLVFQR